MRFDKRLERLEQQVPVARQITGFFDKKPLLVAVTGYGDSEHKKRCVEVGIDLHLLKRADPEYLRMLLLQRRLELGLAE